MLWFRRLFILFCLFATGVVVWGGIYARKEGFTQSWRQAIEREFDKSGYHVEIGKITLGAFRGLVAENVTLFQDETRSEEVAILDRVHLDVDLSRIFKKQVSVNMLDVQEASLSLPLDPAQPGGPRLQVEGLSGRVVFTESMIEILRAGASIADVDLEIKGSLIRAPEEEDEDLRRVREFKRRGSREVALEGLRRQILAIMGEMEHYEFSGKRPLIEVDFRSETENLSSTTALVHIETGEIRRKDQPYKLEEFSARIRYDGISREAEVEEWMIRDREGRLDLTGSWEAETNQFRFDVESGIDLAGIAGWISRDSRLREVVFFSPPEIRAGGVVDLDLIESGAPGFPGEVLGGFQCGRFVTRGVVFAGLDFGFSAAAERFYLRNARLDHQSGVAFLNLKNEPGNGAESVRYQAEIKLDPYVFRPFLNESWRKFLGSWSFPETSTVYLAAEGQGASWKFADWDSKGVVDLRHFRLNGVDFGELETEFEVGEGNLWFRESVLVREEGRIFAEVAHFDPATKLWDLKGVESNVDPIEGARAFHPALGVALRPYQFDRPPEVRLAGLLDGRRAEELGAAPRETELTLSFESEAPARYTFLGKTVKATRSSGEVRISRSRVHLTSLEADCFGGTLELAYDAKNVRSPLRPFEAKVKLNAIPLEAVTLLYADTEKIRGKVDAELRLSGDAGEISSINGEGIAVITEGNLFSIPVLGPLSKLLENNRKIELATNVAREASASFEMRNGVIHTDDIEAFTDTFRVRAAGSVSLVDESLDLEAVVNTKDPLSRAILTPVSELLTFACGGTIREPEWKSKHISNLGKVPEKIITDLTNLPRDGLEELKKMGQGIFRGTVRGEQADGTQEGEESGQAPVPSGRKRLPFLLPNPAR